MKSSMKFSMRRSPGGWVITDPQDAEGGVAFEQAIVDATSIGDGHVEGYIASIHGLSNEVADLCDGKLLRALGVGAQLVSQEPIGRVCERGLTRVRLLADGTIERI